MSCSLSDALHCGMGRVDGPWFGIGVGTGGSSVYESECEHACVV